MIKIKSTLLFLAVISLISASATYAVPVTFTESSGKTSEIITTQAPPFDNGMKLPSEDLIGSRIYLESDYMNFDDWVVTLNAISNGWRVVEREDGKIYYINGYYIQDFYVTS